MFSVVGERLSERGYRVSYFEANAPIDREEPEGLSLFVHKRTRLASGRALITGERLGVATWNSATGVVACVSRSSQLCLLSGVEFAVPFASRMKPRGDYVAKGLYHWDTAPEVNGAGDVYKGLPSADATGFQLLRRRYRNFHRTTVLRATSKPWDERRDLGVTDQIQQHVDRITSLMKQLDMRGIGVDVIRTDDGWYAVDVNPCPSFAQTGPEGTVVDSIESCLDE